jgi:Tfp pilus assembly protein PilO
VSISGLLNKLDLNRFSLRERLIMVLTAASVSIFLFLYVYLPIHQKVPSLIETVEKTRAELSTLEYEVDQARERSERLKARYRPVVSGEGEESESVRELLERIQRIGPEPRKLAHLLEGLNRLANATSVEFLLVRPEKARKKGALMAQPIYIEAKSTLRGMAKFLQMVEGLPSLVKIRNIKLDIDPAQSTYVLAELNMTVYPEER